MTGYLLDTSVISAFTPGKPAVLPITTAWFEARTDRLFLSVMSVIEVDAGIAKLVRAGGRLRADEIREWFGRILDLYGDRVLPIDIDVGHAAGVMIESTKAMGHNPGLADILIAASAAARDLVILTRNRTHFEPLGVSLLDPFADLLPESA